MKDHICDERCRCPKCGSFLYYRYDEHACSNPDCKWIAHDTRLMRGVGEMADTKDLKSFDESHEGSSPSPRTIITFKDKIIHECNKVNLNITVIDGAFSHCPICGDKI